MKDFKLSDKFLQQYEGRQPEWGFGALSYITYKRTYARIQDDGTSEEFWETAKRVVEGTFSIQKRHCAGFKLPWDNRKAQRSAQIMFEKMWNFKFLPPGRGLWMMGTDAIDEKGSGGLNNCFAGETEVITRDGIQRIDHLYEDGKEVELLTNAGWVQAPIKCFGKQFLYEIVLTCSGREKKIFATEDHEWFEKDRQKLYTRVKTKDLRPGKSRLQSSFGPNAIKSIKASAFGIAHGFVFGDGGTRRNKDEAHFIGNKDSAMKKYFYGAGQSDKMSGMPNAFRKLPDIQENKAYLLGWLMGYFAADGSCKSDGTIELCSYEKGNIKFVKDVCSVLGIGTYPIREENRISNLTNRPCTAYKVTFMSAQMAPKFFLIDSHRANFKRKKINYWNVKSVRKTTRMESVFCATVSQHHCFTLADNILTSNCGMVSTNDLDIDFASPFCWSMDFLMLGVGIGFDTEGAGKVVIKEPKKNDGQTYVVPDTREGWIEALRLTIAGFEKGNAIPDFDFSLIRPRGAPIKTFGGTSSGPDPLISLLESIKILLTARIDEAVTSVDIVDMFNFVGKAVVAGNVRRSAELALGKADDEDFLNCKDYNLFPEEMADRRWASNNSVLAEVGMSYTGPSKRTSLNGEPGYIWLENARAYGRLKDPINNKDYRIVGFNPCAEQGLESYELCNLVETFPANHDSPEEYYETLKYAYMYAKTVTLIPTHDPRTNSVMTRNRRIGTSMSGIEQAKKKFGVHSFYTQFCDEGYNVLKGYDRVYSDWLGIAKSIKITTVKPSGTVSLLAGATAGVHAAHAEFYYRTMRIAHDSPIIPALLKAGYRVEYDANEFKSTDRSWETPIDKLNKDYVGSLVAYFPVHEHDFTKGKKEQTIWEQAENAAKMQHYWSDNSVSVTINFQDHEKEQIQTILEHYETRLKTASFLPLSDHGYNQAPYQSIDKAEYDKSIKSLKDIKNITQIAQSDKQIEAFCEGDKCTIQS